jgi:hypothetical protein
MRNWAVLALFWVSFLGLANADSGVANTADVLRYFHVQTSGAPLENTRLFVFGENHTYPSDVSAAAHLIKNFCRPRDILLLEGSDINPSLANEATRPALRWAAQGLLVGGWDDRASVIKFKESLGESLRIGEIVNDNRVGDFERRRLINRVEELENLRENLLDRRHVVMCEKIRAAAAASTSRVFVVAGIYHVDPKSHPELKHCLAEIGLPYATFLPIENHPNRRREMTDAEYQKQFIRGAKTR